MSRSPFLSKIPYSFHLINISKTRQLLNQISPNQSHLLDLIWQRNVWLCGFCMWRWHESKHHIGDLNYMYLIERLGHVGSFEWFNPLHILLPQLSWAFWFVHRLLSWRYIINICTQTRTWQIRTWRYIINICTQTRTWQIMHHASVHVSFLLYIFVFKIKLWCILILCLKSYSSPVIIFIMRSL